ncbi:607_t:CDS:2 [Paraglomus brasilianum]|uniref:607_t:CDS:1 n=1 Tax=Paraglomus brasilianum TaxID=144538 RepID=A0A9N9G1Y0_9GLOM|nr:607_t:CDS:2 [Paraglomus brasilianum]
MANSFTDIPIFDVPEIVSPQAEKKPENTIESVETIEASNDHGSPETPNMKHSVL